MTRLALVLVAISAAGCMTYDFQPVAPLALAQTTQKKPIASRALKPNLMLLVDKSGSMGDPIDRNNPGGPTRISDLRNAMNTFLTQSGTDARMGLILYPATGGGSCAPADSVAEPLPGDTPSDEGTDPTLSSKATAIRNHIQTVQPGGGTPTAASLAFAGTQLEATHNANRDDFILLLTDGLPNCNGTNPNQSCTCNQAVCGGSCGGVGACPAQAAQCRCTLSSCPTTPDSNNFCSLGCLDQDAVVQQTLANKVKGIRTIVVGFGADTAVGDAPNVLNAIAEAGDFPRDCPMGTDAECGTNNRCLANNRCEKKFYQAGDAAELGRAMRNIIEKIRGDACTFLLLAQPSQEEYLTVIVDGQTITRGPSTWDHVGSNIVFQGALCDRIKASTTANPIQVEIRIVESL